MTLESELEKLDSWIESLPKIGIELLGEPGSPMYELDFILVGAVKRSLSIASGFRALIDARNMFSSRAFIRLQLDTVSRLLAYTYVLNPSEVARKVLAGESLHKFKSRDGYPLRDAYLIDQLSRDHSWVKDVYKYTSGYIHFSERQVFDSVQSFSDDDERTINIVISQEEEGFPEMSWIEVVSCMNEMLQILREIFSDYTEKKRAIGQNGK